MKLEKISDNSIRCTIGKQEIDQYNLQLSELVSGDGNAPKFFRDVIIRAHEEFGFEPNNYPLVIEATANMPGNIVFTITKVDNDTDMNKMKDYLSQQQKQDLKKSIFDRMKESFQSWGAYETAPVSEGGDSEEADYPDEAPVYFFANTSNLVKVAKQLKGIYDGESTLYEYGDNFILILEDEDVDSTVYEYSVDILSEYADKMEFSDLYCSLVKEHCNIVMDRDALSRLAEI